MPLLHTLVDMLKRTRMCYLHAVRPATTRSASTSC